MQSRRRLPRPLKNGSDSSFVPSYLIAAQLATAILAVLCVSTFPRRHADLSNAPPRRLTHAWSSVDVAENALPDVEIRQIWVYGHWMRALETETLLQAADLQTRLLAGLPSPCRALRPGNGDPVAPDPTASQASLDTTILHTILLNWNCSSEAISSDGDIISTVDRGWHLSSPSQITLRPESVLSKYVASSGRVVAADAIIATLIYKHSADGQILDESIAALRHGPSKWHIHVEESDAQNSVLGRIRYRQAVGRDHAAFAVLYAVVMLYAAAKLANAPVVRSMLLVLSSLVAEVALSTFFAMEMSFCIGINISTVPPACYPLFALAQCLHNSFALIDKVDAAYQKNTDMLKRSLVGSLPRGPLVITSIAVLALLLLSTSVPAGSVGLCVFGAVSLVLDLCLFLALFPAALAVNLRRPGLVDSVEGEQSRAIAHGNSRQGLQASKAHKGGKVVGPNPATSSSRPHRTAMVLGVVSFAILYSISGAPLSIGNGLGQRLVFGGWSGNRPTYSIAGETIDTVRWLQGQEPRALEELLQAIKPQSSEIVARMHPPLTVVTDLAARNESMTGDAWAASITATAARRKALVLGGTFGSVIVTLVVLRLALLWVIRTQENEGDNQGSETSLARCLSEGHALDIYILASCSRKFLVSVGYDRTILLWDLEAPIPTSQVILPTPEHPINWPISRVAIDNRAEWIALCSQNSHVTLWNRRLQGFGRSFSAESTDPIVACLFACTPARSDPLRKDAARKDTTRLLLVLESGRLIDLDTESNDLVAAQICSNPVQSSHHSSTGNRTAPRLITITRNQSIFVSMNREGWWTTQPLHITVLDRVPPVVSLPMKLSMIPSLRGIGLVHSGDRGELYLVDILLDVVIFTFQPLPFHHNSLRAFHPPSQPCIYCGSIAVASFSVAYAEKQDGRLTIITITAPEELDEKHPRRMLCLRVERDVRERRCTGPSNGLAEMHHMADPGVWEVTGANGVAGMRRRSGAEKPSPGKPARQSASSLSLGRRRTLDFLKQPTAAHEQWEAWTMTARGVSNTHDLARGRLPAKKCGPVCRVAMNAVVVGMANLIVLVQFGKQLHDADDGDALLRPTHGKLSKQRSRIGKATRI